MAISINNPIAQTVIRGLLRQGYSFNKTWNALPDFNLPKYNKTNFLAEARRITGLWKNEYRVKEADDFGPLPRSAMQESDLLEAKPYRVYGTMAGYDEETGEEWERTWSMYDDINRGKQDWATDYLNNINQYWKEQGIVITDIKVRNVEHNKDFPY